MKKWVLFPVLIIMFSCKPKQPESYFTSELALQYFKKVEADCNRDNGKIWGKNLYGPILFIDRNTRHLIANEPDNNGILKAKDGVYSGTYPKEMIIYNGAVKLGGKLYGMAPLPPEEDDYRIRNRAVHGLFHRYQESIGFTSSGYLTANMDEKNARLWLKLEWKALTKALTSQGEEQKLAIRDALVFRGANRELYQKYVADENRFESYEGLAMFTYTMICTNSMPEYYTHLFEYLKRQYSTQSYARSYGSVDGALFATLLYLKNFDFRNIRSENTDLGALVKQAYDIELPSVCRDVAGSLALNYELETIQNEEIKRETDIRNRIHSMTSVFTEKPVVFIELESPYFDFEPEDVHAMDTIGTLYDKMRVSDNWGKLAVEKGGCLVSNNYRFLRISTKGIKTEKNRIEAEGWLLQLNDEWEMIPVNQNYVVRNMIP
jgi:hypothetical protein